MRWRDIGDMRRLRRRGVGVDASLVRSKAGYYRIEECKELLDAEIEQTPELAGFGGISTALNELLAPDTAERILQCKDCPGAFAIEFREPLIDLQREL
ncbi:MAG: hypothetical protein OXI87_01690 [Albidovulum sp.]|nr:hypothetical protein [Albidovulum sp.]MDE0530921.1 hypothetical protein [Albidovulum sp.]